MRPGQRFRFIVDDSIAGRMDRVVLINDGRIISKNKADKATVYEVEKT